LRLEERAEPRRELGRACCDLGRRGDSEASPVATELDLAAQAEPDFDTGRPI
jgi:hypothetical protein